MEGLQGWCLETLQITVEVGHRRWQEATFSEIGNKRWLCGSGVGRLLLWSLGVLRMDRGKGWRIDAGNANFSSWNVPTVAGCPGLRPGCFSFGGGGGWPGAREGVVGPGPDRGGFTC